MQYSIGSDRKKMPHEISIESHELEALAAASAGTRPSTFCWFGQMTNQTLKAMRRPRMPPVIMVRLWTALLVKNTMRPVTTVASADHRNQNRASGAIYWPIAGFISGGIFGMVGICTRLK